MTVLTQGVLPLEFLVSEGNGQISREQVTVAIAGSVALPSGTVLGRVTASGKYVKYDDAGTDDGRRTAVAVLMTGLPGVNGDARAAVIARNAEVFGAMLNGGAGVDANGRADLAAVGIIVR